MCDSSDFESVFVNVTSSPGKSVLIGAIYRPPGGDINRFNDLSLIHISEPTRPY